MCVLGCKDVRMGGDNLEIVAASACVCCCLSVCLSVCVLMCVCVSVLYEHVYA